MGAEAEVSGELGAGMGEGRCGVKGVGGWEGDGE